MSTITIPISGELEEFIKSEIKAGTSETKVHVVRYALKRLQEERAIARLQEAEQDIKDGRVFKGNLRALLKKVK
jgi:Arc/MetJ-type ribon-helix-helix transcriptional regulator